MTREWKPGDVALVRPHSLGAWAVALKSADGEVWLCGHTGGGHSHPVDQRGLEVRPLVTIDPEDREQVERFTHLFLRHHWSQEHQTHTNAGQAALREFADPKPPKPEEPTGLGAVVEDVDGVKWVRADTVSTNAPWHRIGSYSESVWSYYLNLAVVRVLSEGVQP